MNLSTLSIKRHVLTWSLSLALLILGFFGFSQIGVDRYPEVEFPVLVVATTLEGAAPEVVATNITSPIEKVLNTISGIDSIQSESRTGRSLITLQFSLETDLIEAYADVQSKIGAISSRLPEGVETPAILKFDPNARPVLFLSVSAENKSISELTSFAQIIQKKVQTMPGIGEVALYGAKDEVIEISINEEALYAQGLNYSDIQRIFSANHLRSSSGLLKSNTLYFTVNQNFEYSNPQDIGLIVVKEATETSPALLLSELADIRFSIEDARKFSKFNGNDTVTLGIVKLSGANTVAVVDNIIEKLPELQKLLPEDFSIQVSSDLSGPIKDLVKTLKSHLVEGVILTSFVVFLFLQSLRATAIISLAIPVSLAGAIAATYLLGYSFNSFTLLALLLLIGVVVDDAIVVLENIVARMKATPNKSQMEIAKEGADQVYFPVMASTLTLVCIFLPILFLPGMIGKFFESFAAVVTAGVLTSWFVALTLTPMLCSRWLSKENIIHKDNALERFHKSLESGYQKSLKMAFNYKKSILLMAALTLIPSFILLKELPKTFMPESNEGRVGVTVQIPAGSKEDEILSIMETAQLKIKKIPEVESIFWRFNENSRSSASEGIFSLSLAQNRSKTQSEVIKSLNQELTSLVGAKVRAYPISGIGGGRSDPLQFYVTGPNYQEVLEISKKIDEDLQKIQGFGRLQVDLSATNPELKIEPINERLITHKVSRQALANAIQVSSGSYQLGQYTDKFDERKPIVLTSDKRKRVNRAQDLESILVRNADGEMIKVGELVKVVEKGAPNSLSRFSQQYSIGFFSSPEIPLGQAIEIIKESSVKHLKSGYSIEYSGQAVEFQKTGKNLGIVFSSAFVFLYLVLASQFNSFSKPLIVLLAQPLALIGALLGLYIGDFEISIYSVIGLLLLLGLVTKNSILLVDRALEYTDELSDKAEAMLKAAPERLRPVLMTSLTLILALGPTAFGVGAGAEFNAPLASAVIGGMISSTILTLYVIPCVYALKIKSPFTCGKSKT